MNMQLINDGEKKRAQEEEQDKAEAKEEDKR